MAMRDTVVGVILGVWITMFVTWLERHKMSNFYDVAFYIVTGILVLMLSFRLVLKLLAHARPEWYLRVNSLFAPVPIDDTFLRRIDQRAWERAAKGRKKDGTAKQ